MMGHLFYFLNSIQYLTFGNHFIHILQEYESKSNNILSQVNLSFM